MRKPLHGIRSVVLALVGLTLPLEESSVSIAGLPITPNKAMAALLLGVVALQWATERRRSHGDPKRVWVAFLAFGLGISGVQSLSSEVRASYVILGLITWYTLFLFYFLLVYTLVSRRDLDRLLFFFILGSIAAFVSGAIGYGVQIESVRYGTRIGGEGGNPNLLAFNLLITIAAAAALSLSATARWKKRLYLLVIGIALAGVVASLSRSAYLALPVAGLLMAIRLRRLDFLRHAVPALVVVAFVVLLAPAQVGERLLSLTPDRIEDDASARGRLAVLPGAMRAFAGNPITGVGLGRYPWWAYEHGLTVHGIHNAYLALLTETGLLGFVPFAAVLVLSWREFNRARRFARHYGRGKDRELRLLDLRATLLQAGFAGLLVMSLGQPTQANKGLWLMLALSTALRGLVVTRARELPAAERDRPGSEPVDPRPAGAAAEATGTGPGPGALEWPAR